MMSCKDFEEEESHYYRQTGVKWECLLIEHWSATVN
jgi:hypothetical protein